MTRPSQRPLCPLRWHGSPVSAPAGHPGPAAVFPCRAGPAPITSLSIVGLCASGGSGYRAGGGLQAPCQAGGREGGRGPARARMKGERLGNPGGSFLLPLPCVLKVPPRKLLVLDIQLSEEKGPGGSFDAAALGSRAPAHPGRTPAACSDTSPRPPGSSPCDKSQASCLPRQGWAAATSSSEAKSQELASVPESGASSGFRLRVGQPGRRVTGHPAQPEPALRTPSRERVGRLGLGPEAAVTQLRGTPVQARGWLPQPSRATPPGPRGILV